MTISIDAAPSAEAPAQASDKSKAHDLSHQAHRQLIGYLGILLPLVLFGLAGLRPTPGLQRWVPLESVSAYYYTGAVAAFVGILFALALFLFTYGGYKGYLADRIVGRIGAFCALGVAFFPTAAPGGLSEPSWWREITRTIHYVSASTLFLVFIVFSLWLFRKTGVPKGEPLPLGKRQRNRVYLICGLVMVVNVLWAGSSYFTGADIFWAEVFALWAFAVSWLVKGYAHRPVVEGVKRVLAG
jgi:hypothetical protein